MNSIAPFNEVDRESDINAFKTISSVIPMIFAEVHVFRSLFVYLTMIAGNIVIYPFQLIKGIGNLNDPQYKYGLCIFICIVLTFVIPLLLGYDSEDSLDFVRTQKYYKIWAIYTLFFIIQRFLARVHVHTHKIIRGAIREGKSVFFPIVLHCISNFLILFSYNVYSSTYLAGLYGKKNIFISACLHIEAIIAKKYLPKVLDYPPQFTMPVERLVLLYSILLHVTMGNIRQLIPLIGFEYLFVFFKFFLTAISEDSTSVYQCLKIGADSAFYQFNHNDANIDDSIILNVPIEVFSISTLFLIAKGPTYNTIFLLAGVIVFAVVGRLIVKLLCPKVKPVPPKVGKKDKKDKKDKNKDKSKDKPSKDVSDKPKTE